MNNCAKVVLATVFTSTALFSQAESSDIFQDCLLEGKVQAHKADDGANVVRIDFYKAQPYKPESRCIIDGSLEFKQPKGSIREN